MVRYRIKRHRKAASKAGCHAGSLLPSFLKSPFLTSNERVIISTSQYCYEEQNIIMIEVIFLI